MILIAEAGGSVRCLYDETIDFHRLGAPDICRASHVEPDTNGSWYADLEPVHGPRLTGFAMRSEALAAERDWLEANLLSG